MIRALRLVLPAVGLLLLGYLIGTLGLEQVLHHFAVMKWWFPAILLVAFLWHVSNSIAWSFAFQPDAFRPKLRTLFMAKLAGEAVNQLTPLANIGGEPLKAYLLKNQVPASRGLASVIINKTAQVMTGLGFTALGLALVILYWDLPQAIPLPVQLGLSLLLAAGCYFVWLVYHKQRHMFSSLLTFLRGIGLNMNFIEDRMAKAVRIDSSISMFYEDHKGRFFLVLGFHAVGWLLGVCETYLVLRVLDAPVDFEIAFLIASLTVIINSLFFFMPSNIGVLEGSQVFLFMTLGLDPGMGLFLGITKRMRKIFWISIGWLFLTHLSRVVGRDLPATQTDPEGLSDRDHSGRVSYF